MNKFSSSVFLLFFVFGVISVQSTFDKLEGKPCQSEGVPGKFVHINKCLSAYIDMKKGKLPTINSSKRKKPIVCCTDCKLVNDTRKAIIAKDGTVFFKSGQKARDKCIDLLALLPETCETGGMTYSWHSHNTQKCKTFHKKGFILKRTKRLSTIAIGATAAKRYKFLHMALLGYGEDWKSAVWQCGGSLISERFILTAAHCTSRPDLGTVRFVVLGILKRSDPHELWNVYNVQRIILHPDYHSPSQYHDIALLETDKPVTYSKSVFPACLDVQGKFFKDFNEDIGYEELTEEQQKKEFQRVISMQEEPAEDQTRAVATGWGRMGRKDPLADTLQEVHLQRFSENRCLKCYPPHRLLTEGYNATMQMCYGDDNEPKDTCEGDSGGPLQVMSQISKCLHTVIGVTAFGRGCSVTGDAGMYTRVSHYIGWIESEVWKD